jgi:electron transfer flavoprotein beta subunit
MKILVCLTQAPDTTTKISFTDNDTKLNENGVTWVINPYDEWYSLVRALELKEAGLATDIHIVTLGRTNAEQIIRKALALGGDEAYRIEADADDNLYIASQIAHFAKAGNYSLVLVGKESIDYNSGSTGAMIAELLDMPYIANATKVDVAGQEATITREIDGGQEVDTCALPIVVGCQKGVAEARIPNMRGIMAARTKPLTVISPIEMANATTIVKYEMPAAKTGVKMLGVDDMDELVRLLHEEAKVI